MYHIAMVVIGCLIIREYWLTEQFSAIKQFSFYIVALTFTYIILHMAKRLLWSRWRWWDYLYYFALFSMIAPVLWANSNNEVQYHWLVDIGTCFLVIPALLDIYIWFLKLKKRLR